MFRKLLVIVTSVIIGCGLSTLVFASAGQLGSYNLQGVSGAPVVVATSATKVMAFSAGRQEALICNVGTVVEYCASGPAGGGVPSPAPTTAGANGTPLFASTCLTLNANLSYTPYGMGLVAQAELDCACSSGTCPTSAWELP